MRVYKFGLLPPKENAAIVREQMWLAHRYRNTLIEIERARRAALRDIYGSAGDIPTLETAAATAAAEETAAASALKAKRAASRSRSETEEDRECLRRARAARSEAVRCLREARAKIREDASIGALSDEVNDRANALVRGARALSGLFWGTYLLVEAAMQASKAMPLYDGASPNDPHFIRWDYQPNELKFICYGQVGVQIQGGLAIEKVFGETDRRVRIDRSDSAQLHSLQKRGGPNGAILDAPRKRSDKHVALYMRVGSNDDGTPIWASFPMILHRDIPLGSTVKWVKVSCRRRGPRREEWSVDITVDEPAARPTCGRGVVGIDIGWRQFGDEIRVAAWKGSDGAFGELRLSREMIARFRKPDDLRSIRDKNFDVARAALASWLSSQASLPEWFRLASQRLSQWKSPARLAGLVRRWRSTRFDGDAEAFQAAEAWRYHDDHLWEWESYARRGALNARREVFRIFGAELAKKYEIVAFEEFDLRCFAARPVPEADAENETARSNRHMVATSELRLAVKNAFLSRGGIEMKVDAVNTTRECHVCGVVETFDAAKELSHTCANGHAWDQDANASENLVSRGLDVLLDRMRERLRDEREAGGARKDAKANDSEKTGSSRWAKAKALSAAKKARKEGARNPVPNPAE